MSEHRFDVVIVGGGLVGSSVAMHLAETGVTSIAMVDVDLGGRYSSSELNAGGVRATWRTEINVALALASIEFFEAVRDDIAFRFRYDGSDWFEERIWPRLAARMSRCREMRHRSGWAGLYEYTPDCSGVVGIAPGQPRIVEAFGFTGRGAMQSYAVGRAVAELVTGGRYRTLDLTPLRPTRFADGALVHETLHI